jgi:hypothetical protein
MFPISCAYLGEHRRGTIVSKWTEAELQRLIDDGEPETNQREYKAAGALDGSQGKKAEISKDVSAMANAAGGTIIYGIAEDSQGIPSHIDGVDPTAFSVEWLDSVIRSNIQPPINGLLIEKVPLADGKVAYVVEVPQATSRAPHMAKDNRYHWRANATTAAMEDFQVRDVMRRATTPVLTLDVQISKPYSFGPSKRVSVKAALGNEADVPALYSTVVFAVPDRAASSVVQDEPWTGGRPFWAAAPEKMRYYEINLAAPNDQPVYPGRVAHLHPLRLQLDPNHPYYPIAYRIATPGFILERSGAFVWDARFGSDARLEWD